MSIHLLRHALSMPPHLVARKAARVGLRLLRRHVVGRWHRARRSYAAAPDGPLARLLAPLEHSALAACRETLARLAPLYLEHRFDLLGSGWVRVGHGDSHAGFGEHRYSAGPALGDGWRAALADGHWPANRAPARALLDAVDDPAYRPIDWQVDFKSGYRWSVRAWGPTVSYGHLPGIDIKVPWELARLQHLPQLALLFAIDGTPELAREVRNQILDFLGSNPPGWGVNWACAMDVAIRAANMVLARELLLAGGAVPDEVFEKAFAGAMVDHGRFVMAHLEWTGEHRGNHYLADICGLAFAAAVLPGEEAAAWRDFAAEQLAAELKRQFLADGGNFEASTAYHRLSAEMALYATALLADRLPKECVDIVERAVDFAVAVTKPSGRAIQVGDNDSGRFFKLVPAVDGTAERVLDFTSLWAAASGLFTPAWSMPEWAAPEAAVVAALAGRRHPRTAAGADAVPEVHAGDGVARRVARVEFHLPDAAALDGLRPCFLPAFGLYIWRNDRCFLAVRCGPIGQNGQGGHAHNDQLAVELEVDGVDWVADPGTFVYTADLAERNRYRSVLAHFAPRRADMEPARLLAPFQLEDRARAQVVRASATGFVGLHHGFGLPVYRRVGVADGRVVVEDLEAGLEVTSATEVERHVVTAPGRLPPPWDGLPPFSAGYGLR